MSGQKRQALFGIACLLVIAWSTPGHSQAHAPWPTQPVRMIVNTAPGGSIDVMGRILASELSKTIGQPVIVENRGGANGNIAAEAVARAAPDGYTLLMSSGGTLTTNPHLYKKMTFDPLKDLVPITQVGFSPLLLMIRAELPAANLREFIAYLKANSGKTSYASAGSGSALHIAQESFGRMAGVQPLHVPFKGAGPALAAVVSGQVDFLWDTGPGLAHVRAGKLRLLAVSTSRRVSVSPDTPTASEAGLPGFEYASAHALLAPAGTPRPIIERLNREGVRALQSPEVRDRFKAMGADVIGNSPEKAAANIQFEHARLGKLVREAGIRLE